MSIYTRDKIFISADKATYIEFDPGTGTARFVVNGTEMMSLTTSVAKLGGKRVIGGQHTTVTASDTVATGLTTVDSVVAVLEDNPGDNPMLVSAQKGDQAGAPAAGSIIIKTWQNTSGSDPTPVAATTFSKKVNWIAFGS